MIEKSDERETPNESAEPVAGKDIASAETTAAPSATASAPAEDLDLSPVVPKSEEEPVGYQLLSVETQPGARIDAKVQVPETDFEKRLETILKDLRKNVVVDGFRRGHAPLRMLRNIYGKDAQREAVEKMRDAIVKPLAKENDWKVVGEAEVKDFAAETGKPLEIVYTFEVMPKVEVSDDLLRSIAVEVGKKEVSEATVEEELERLRRMNATYEAKSPDQPFDPEKDGLAVDLFVTDAKGRNRADLSRMDEFLENPKSALPEDVVNALAGKKVGDHVDVTISAAAAEKDESAPRAEGELIYHVDIKGIKALLLPSLDDEFAKDVGEKYKSLADLRTELRRDLEEQAQQQQRTEAAQAVFKAILEKSPFEVPKSLVAITAAGRIERHEKMLAQYGIRLSQVLGDRVESYVESTTQGAEFAVKVNLITRALVDRENLEVTEPELEQEFQRLGEKSGRSAMAMRAHYEARKQLDDLKEDLRRRKVESFLLERAQVTYKTPSPTEPPADTAKPATARKKSRKPAKPKEKED